MKCSEPPSPANGVMSCSGNGYMDTCAVVCHTGFESSVNHVHPLSCDADGTYGTALFPPVKVSFSNLLPTQLHSIISPLSLSRLRD